MVDGPALEGVDTGKCGFSTRGGYREHDGHFCNSEVRHERLHAGLSHLRVISREVLTFVRMRTWLIVDLLAIDIETWEWQRSHLQTPCIRIPLIAGVSAL
jgi:hypothetical protein